MELGRVTDNWPDSIGHSCLDVDRFCQGLPEHPCHFVDQVLRLKENLPAFDASCELQYLLDHLAAAFCIVLKDSKKSLAVRIGEFHLQHSDSEKDGRQNVIYIVCNSTSEC